MKAVNKTLLSIMLMGAAAMPSFVFAQIANPLYAGTAEYLRRELGYTEEQLTTPTNTEEREPFDNFVGEGKTIDPLGDVLNNKGQEAEIQFPSADLKSAKLEKNTKTDTWDITFTVGGIIPEHPSEATQFLAYIDRDDDTTNNEFQGIGIGTDAIFIVQWTPEDEEWQTRFRWFNPAPEFWARNLETESTFEIEGNQVMIHIPFSEIPSDVEPIWRAVAAVAEGLITQVDDAPTVGFPPITGETLPEAPDFDQKFYEKPFAWIVGGLIVLSFVLIGIIFKRRRRSRTKEE